MACNLPWPPLRIAAGTLIRNELGDMLLVKPSCR